MMISNTNTSMSSAVRSAASCRKAVSLLHSGRCRSSLPQLVAPARSSSSNLAAPRLLAARAAPAAGAAADGGGEPEGRTPWYQKPCGPQSVEVASVEELLDVLATDRLVLVDFFAPWCGACRALYPKLSKLLHEYPDTLLVKVNFEANRAMCKTLGIKVLPYFQLYSGAQGRVAAFSATSSKIQRLKDALELHSGAICSLEPPPGLAEFPDLHAEHPSDATLLGRDAWDAPPAAVPAGAAAAE